MNAGSCSIPRMRSNNKDGEELASLEWRKERCRDALSSKTSNCDETKDVWRDGCEGFGISLTSFSSSLLLRRWWPSPLTWVRLHRVKSRLKMNIFITVGVGSDCCCFLPYLVSSFVCSMPIAFTALDAFALVTETPVLCFVNALFKSYQSLFPFALRSSRTVFLSTGMCQSARFVSADMRERNFSLNLGSVFRVECSYLGIADPMSKWICRSF